jgi:outer membrane protein
MMRYARFAIRRSFRFALWSTFLSALLLPLGARGQGPGPSPSEAPPASQEAGSASGRQVTLEEMYREALARNEQVGIAREGLYRSEKEVNRSIGFLLPQLTLQAQYLRRPETLFGSSNTFILRPKEEEQFSAVLTQPLFTGGRALAAYRIAKRGVEGSRHDLNNVQEQLLFGVAQAYYTALKARKNVAIDEAEVTRLEAHRRDAEKRFQVGEVTKTVVLRAEAELSGARANLIKAKNDVETAKNQLSLLTKVPLGFDLEEPALLDAPAGEEAELIRQAMENRPDLARERINIEIARQGVKSARGTFLPSLNLQGRYDWIDQSPSGSFLVRRDRSALLVLNFPLFEGGTRIAELSQARSKVSEAELNRSLLENQISLQVRNDLLTLASITSALQNLRDEVAFARDNFAMVSRQFAVGLATNIDVLDANATLNTAELQLANTMYDRELVILQVYRDIGIFTKKVSPI